MTLAASLLLLSPSLKSQDLDALFESSAKFESNCDEPKCRPLMTVDEWEALLLPSSSPFPTPDTPTQPFSPAVANCLR